MATVQLTLNANGHPGIVSGDFTLVLPLSGPVSEEELRTRLEDVLNPSATEDERLEGYRNLQEQVTMFYKSLVDACLQQAPQSAIESTDLEMVGETPGLSEGVVHQVTVDLTAKTTVVNCLVDNVFNVAIPSKLDYDGRTLVDAQLRKKIRSSLGTFVYNNALRVLRLVVIDFIEKGYADHPDRFADTVTWLRDTKIAWNVPDRKDAQQKWNLTFHENTDHECAVCLGMEESSVVMSQLPCGHVFHYWCLLGWLDVQTTCPLCRASIVSVQDGN